MPIRKKRNKGSHRRREKMNLGLISVAKGKVGKENNYFQ